MTKHSTYSKEYKLQAIQLAKTEGIKGTAQNLGINPTMLGRWKREYETRVAQAKPVFLGRGIPALSNHDKEIQQLRLELEVTRQERDIVLA